MPNNEKMKKLINQFGKFALVGILNTALDWLIFLILTSCVHFFSIQENEIWAKTISFSIAVINSFLLNTFWTFRKEYQNGLSSSNASVKTTQSIFLLKFFLISTVGLLINDGFFLLGRQIDGRIFALFFATFFSLIWNFFANKYWTYSKISKKVVVIFGIMIILSASFLLSAGSMRNDSMTADEGVHIGAGYTYLTRGDFRFDPEHPPLIKEITATPLLFMRLNLPDQGERLWQEAENFYFDSWVQAREFGNSLIYKSGNNAGKILFFARLPMLLLYLVLSLFVFLWAKKLFGLKAGFIAMILTAFCPNLMAHGRLANTDLGLALFFIVAVYFWGECLKNPSSKRALFAGLFLGLALSTKYTAIILPLVFVILAVIRIYQTKKWQIILFCLMSLVVSYLVIWATYCFSLYRMPLTENIAAAISNVNLNTNIPQGIANNPIAAKFTHLLIPAYYFKGLIMVLIHAAHGHSSYLLGELSKTGWWYYFPIAFVIKTPTAVLLLLIVAIFSFRRFPVKDKFDEILLILPPIIFFAFAMLSKANLGLRHVLLIYPFIYIYISRLSNVFNLKNIWPKIALTTALVWFLAANLFIYPSYLAYFNELIGGPKNGPKYLSDSNIDWSADVKRLSQYLKKQNIEQVYLDYFWDKEALDYYEINYVSLSPEDKNVSGYLVLSVVSLQSGRYNWLKNYQPIERIGYSTYVYHIEKK